MSSTPKTSDDFVTEQVFFASKDGVKVPMFLTYKKDLKKDGKNPVFLYGYGGFGISLNPGHINKKRRVKLPKCRESSS